MPNEPNIPENDSTDYQADDVVLMPIDGMLDLHTFAPKDVKSLVPDYLNECRNASIFEVRIVHGKGKGVLRRIVHSTLDTLDYVASYQSAGPGRGSWGATIVQLHPLNPRNP